MNKTLFFFGKHQTTGLLALMLWVAAVTTGRAQNVGVQLVQNGQFSVYPGTTAAASGTTPKATYTISAGTNLGAWRSDRVYATTDADPTVRGQVSVQLNNTSYVSSPANTSLTPSSIVQRTYSDFNPPSASNTVTGTTTLNTFLLYRGDGSGAGGSVWIQNLSVLPNTTYTVSYWASNAAPVGSTATTAVVPPQLVMAGTQLVGGVSTPLVLTPAAGQVQAIPFEATTDIWTKYTYTFTTTGTAGAATNVELRLNDIATAGTLRSNDDEVAVTNISVRASSASAGTAFDCNNAAFYQMRQTANAAINGVSGSSSRLFTVNRATSPYTTTQALELGATLNSMGYEPNNAYLYAMTYTGNTSGAVPSGASGRESQPSALVELVKIGTTGAESLGFISNLPVKQWAGGTIDRNFNMYLKTQDYDNAIYRVDLSATPISAVTLATSDYFTSYDLAYDPTSNLMYGVSFPGSGSNGSALFSINTATSPVTVNNIGSPLIVNGNYNSNQLDTTQPLGTAFFDVSGTLYAYGNGPTNNNTATSGKFYTINKTTGVASTVNTINGATNSDGASCINPSQQIDVVKQLSGVALVPGNVNQRDVTYTLYLRNTATTTDANVQVSDFLWGSSTNVAFPTATAGALQGSITVTNQDGSNLSANAAFTGQGTAVGAATPTSPTLAALLNTSTPQVLTAGQRAQISFTIRLTFPNGAVPSATQYNTALASNTSTSGNTGYTQLTTGALLPPINLNANDASTNGSTFPALRSSGTVDSPAPTPSTFQPAIYGNVFEDVNYGGGSGRSLLASDGVSRSGVRVELYNNSGSTATFKSSTTTDASGNYSFVNLTAGNTYTVRVVNNGTNAVSSSRTGAVAALQGVQTWRYNDGERVGGESPAKVDGPNVTTVGAALSSANAAATTTSPAATAQNIVAVLLPSTTATATTSVDFGFNFSTVVNTNDTGQGSLRQFLTNANTLGGENTLAQDGIRADSTGTNVRLPAGRETSIFMIPDGAAHPGLTAYNATTNPGLASQLSANAAAVITATATLTLSGGANAQNTNLDGGTQTANVGNNRGTASNAAATMVGTSGLMISAVRRTSVEVQAAGVTTLLDVEVVRATVRALALHSADDDTNAQNNQVVLVGNSASATSYLFENVLIGTTASGLRPTSYTSNGYGLNLKGNSGVGTVVHSLLAFNGQSCLNINNGTGTTGINQFTNNFLLKNGYLDGGGDGMTFGDGGGSGPANVTKNSFANQNSSGIQFEIGSTSATTVVNNTISAAGIIRQEGSGVSLEGSGIDYLRRDANRYGSQADVIRNNVITGSYSAGIVVGYGQQNVTITQNSLYSNDGLGIDLIADPMYYVGSSLPIGSLNYGNGDGVTVNDGNNPATAGPGLPNKGVDFPVLNTARINSGNTVTVTGYSRPGAVVEFFVRDTDITGFGEGQTYLVTRTEGTNQDADGTSGSYGPGNVNGLNQGSDSNASKFTFTFTVTSDQRATLIANGLTSTATLSTSTSEFSGKVTVIVDPLPVTLTVFTAQAVANRDGLLKWTTATETDNDHFDVERSLDGTSFTKIGQVAGQGTKLTATNYTLTDAGVAAKATGPVYYRLRQVDRDGTATYSPVRSISFTAAAGGISLYPTLTGGTATLDLSQLPATNTYQVLLTDMTGRAVRTWAVTGGQLQTLDVTDAAQGIYHVRVTGQQPNGAALSQSLRLTKQ